jgi:hypothetical protein
MVAGRVAAVSFSPSREATNSPQRQYALLYEVVHRPKVIRFQQIREMKPAQRNEMGYFPKCSIGKEL